MPLGNRVVLAVTDLRRDQPFVCYAGIWNDVSIDFAIDGVEFPPALRRQCKVTTTEIDPANLAIVRVAQAEQRVPQGGSTGVSKPIRASCSLSARGSPKKAASEAEAQHMAAVIAATTMTFAA